MTVGDVVGVGAILLCVAVAVFVVKLPRIMWRLRNPPEKIEAERQAREDRLRRPNWEFYSEHLRRPVPEALRQLFADMGLRPRVSIAFEIGGASCYVTDLEPIDEQGLRDARTYYGLDIVPFAGGDDDVYYLKPGADESDAVYEASFHDRNDGPNPPVADDVSLFVEALRSVAKKES